MADWQERVQSMIMGFVFAYMVMKLFSVIANFRAGNMRVERAEVETETETEAEAEAEAEPGRENASSSSSSDEEEEEAPAVEPKEVELPEEKKDTLKVESEEEGISGGGSAFEEETTVGGASEGEADEEDEDWEGVESTELEKRFGAASTFADDMSVNNPEATLQLHALYKIATEGPCSSSQPSAFQPTARAKWNAWQKLGSMSQEEAMRKYIELVTAINPNWFEDYQGKEATQQKQADGGQADS